MEDVDIIVNKAGVNKLEDYNHNKLVASIDDKGVSIDDEANSVDRDKGVDIVNNKEDN